MQAMGIRPTVFLSSSIFRSSLFLLSRKKHGIAPCGLLLLIVYFSSAGTLAALDPTRHISQYGHTVWRTQDGVFGSMPRLVAQTTDGYLWFGTIAGLWRFAVSQSYAGSVLLDFVGIGAEGYVFVGTFVSCAAMLVFEHLGEIRGRLPPWRLDPMPGVGKHREHGETDQ